MSGFRAGSQTYRRHKWRNARARAMLYTSNKKQRPQHVTTFCVFFNDLRGCYDVEDRGVVRRAYVRRQIVAYPAATVSKFRRHANSITPKNISSPKCFPEIGARVMRTCQNACRTSPSLSPSRRRSITDVLFGYIYGISKRRD